MECGKYKPISNKECDTNNPNRIQGLVVLTMDQIIEIKMLTARQLEHSDQVAKEIRELLDAGIYPFKANMTYIGFTVCEKFIYHRLSNGQLEGTQIKTF